MGLATTYYAYNAHGYLIEIRVEPESSTSTRKKPSTLSNLEVLLKTPAKSYLTSLLSREAATLDEERMTRSVRSGNPGKTCAYGKVYDCVGNCIDEWDLYSNIPILLYYSF